MDVDQDIPVRACVRILVLMNRSDGPVLGPYHSAGVEPVSEEETCQYDCQDGYSNDEPFPRGLGLPRKKTGSWRLSLQGV